MAFFRTFRWRKSRQEIAEEKLLLELRLEFDDEDTNRSQSMFALLKTFRKTLEAGKWQEIFSDVSSHLIARYHRRKGCGNENYTQTPKVAKCVPVIMLLQYFSAISTICFQYRMAELRSIGQKKTVVKKL